METFWYRKAPVISKSIYIGLILSAVVWSIIGFKHFEPILWPVIQEFEITHHEQTDKGTAIQGDMLKTRDCEFIEVVAYSGKYLVDVEFTETHTVVTRIEGHQAWGVWLIVPPVKELTLYSRHQCLTGTVVTKLFDGLLL